jgi:hypothetical protein
MIMSVLGSRVATPFVQTEYDAYSRVLSSFNGHDEHEDLRGELPTLNAQPAKSAVTE